MKEKTSDVHEMFNDSPKLLVDLYMLSIAPSLHETTRCEWMRKIHSREDDRPYSLWFYVYIYIYNQSLMRLFWL